MRWCPAWTRWPHTCRRTGDALLIVLFGLVAFLLVCSELYEADVWWHLRSGEWVLEHGRPPEVDPFAFGSQGRPWIDLHWGYQVLLSLVFRAGGTGAVIAFGAAVVAAAAVTALAARPPGASLPWVLLGWVPALLLLSVRNQPRPEIFTLLFLSVYLAVLARLDDRPRLAWLLPAVQILWVNVHALFVLGPAVLGMWLLARAGGWAREWLRGRTAPPGRRHVLGAGVAVLLACLLNPYGVRGALFPLVLYPKVTEEADPYKQNVGEFLSPRAVAALMEPGDAGNNWYFCGFYLVLLLIPLSFLLPALWRASRLPAKELGGKAAAPPSVRSSLPWLGVLAVSVALLVVHSGTLSARGRPGWLAAAGEAVPLLAAAAGVGGWLLLGRRSPGAAGLALCGGCGLAAWMGWLSAHLRFGSVTDPTAGSPAPALLVVAALCGIVAAALVLRWGGNLFGLLLAGAFAYLALRAMYNWGRLGLAAGVVVGGNLGPWVGELLPEPAARRLGRGVRLGLGALLLGWASAVLTGAYPKRVGYVLGFREQPLHFPHDAARFAGQTEMPPRSVVFPLEAASLYVYHAAPGHLTFMDPRLEVPSLPTFQTYLAVWKRLNEGDSRGVASLGAPVVLVAHADNAHAEAALLAHPDWRLLYFDALGAVFLTHTDPGLEARFPTLDLAARHFTRPPARSLPDTPGAAAREAEALLELGRALGKGRQARWGLRVPVLLAALGRAEAAVGEGPDRAHAWLLLGGCHAALLPELRGPPRPAGRGWDPETGLGWAQATYCFRRGLEADPENVELLLALHRSYAAREMRDAQREVAGRLLALGRRPPRAPDGGRAREGPFDPDPSGRPSQPIHILLARLLDGRRPAAAARLAEEALARGEGGWDWPLADRVAGACLHLGQPALARRVWLRAKSPPTEAVRHSRLADACWVERDFEAAAGHYREARRLDPRLPEPCWALAYLYAELGQSGPALEACREGLSRPLPAGLRDELTALEALLRKYAPGAN